MDRIATYSPNQIVTSAQLNAIQDQAVGALALATGNLSTVDPGERVIHWESATDIATNTITTIDGVNVWTDYVVMWALDIKGGASNLFPFQGCNQIGLVDNFSAANVNDDCIVLHTCDRCCVDNTICLRI